MSISNYGLKMFAHGIIAGVMLSGLGIRVFHGGGDPSIMMLIVLGLLATCYLVLAITTNAIREDTARCKEFGEMLAEMNLVLHGLKEEAGVAVGWETNKRNEHGIPVSINLTIAYNKEKLLAQLARLKGEEHA